MDGLTTKQAAAKITIEYAPQGIVVYEWQVRRVFELGMLPEPQKFANKRVIVDAIIPQIVTAIRQRGWLPQQEPSA